MLAHYRLSGVGPAEREATVRGMGIERGAVPAEVQMVLEALALWGRHHLAQLEPDAAAETELQVMPQREVARYVAQLPHRVPTTPPPAPLAASPPGLASIFENASETSRHASWAQASEQEAVLSCPHCGGPQQQIRNFLCSYCHRPLGG